jgi:FixJ family two-component response regulator
VTSSNSEIFIVDDDPGVAIAFSIVFTRAGYQATVFTDGKVLILSSRRDIPSAVEAIKNGACDLKAAGCRYNRCPRARSDRPVVTSSTK